MLAGNKMVYIFFNIVGLGSIAGWTWISVREKREVSGYTGGGAVVLTAVMFLLLKLQIKTPTSNEEVTQAAEALKRITWLPWAGLVTSAAVSPTPVSLLSTPRAAEMVVGWAATAS